MAHEFGPLLRSLRRQAGLTQEQLALASGLSVDGIGALERGHRLRPRRDTISLLVAALGLDQDDAATLQSAAVPPRRKPPRAAERRRVGWTGTPHQLPAAPSVLVGRETLASDIESSLTGPTGRAGARPRVVALTGMGGIGKTALALVVAHRAAPQFPDGQLYLDLRGHGRAAGLSLTDALAHLLTSLGLHADDVPVDEDRALAAYRTRTSGSRLLVVLDNARDAAQVDALLPSGSENAVVVTSRASLGAQLEARQHALSPLPEDVARELLAERVGHQRMSSDEPASRTVIASCAGLPLALRIVAARMQARPQWAVSDVAQRLADRDTRLTELDSQGLAVATSLGDSVDQLRGSPDPTDQDAAELWLTMGVMPAPQVGLSGISHACSWPPDRTERAVERLAEVSLLEEPAPGRFRMHDLVHDLAHRRAGAELGRAEQDVRRRAALAHYVALAWRSRSLVRSTPEGFDDDSITAGMDPECSPRDCLAVIDEESEQLLRLLDEAGDDDKSAELIPLLALGLVSLFVTRVDNTRWADTLAFALDRVPQEATDARVWLLQDLAMAHSGRGQHDLALRSAERAADLAGATGRREAEAAALNACAIALRRLGRLSEALDVCGRALVLFEREGDVRGQAIGLRDMGQLHFQNGDLETGIGFARRSLAIYEQIDVPRGLTMSHLNLGVMLRERGDLTDALHHLALAVSLSRDVGDLALETEALDELGEWHLLAGDAREGITVLRDGLAVIADHGSGQWEASIRRRLAIALESLGRPAEADEQWVAALRICEQRGESDQAAQLRQEWARCRAERAPASRDGT